MPNGLKIKRISVPFGVIGIIYEARPNVSFDVFSLCFKSGNACILKGGSDADYSNLAIISVIHDVLKRFEVDLQKQAISIEQLQEGISEAPVIRSMKQALASSKSGVIAEFKRRSPSKGWIKQDARPEEIVLSYATAGASALSILTDEKFFGGSLKDIRIARPLVEIPILRKDFIIDEYQLYQAKIVGADAVLLIAAALEQEKCNELTEKAHSLGLEVLLEIHSPEELSYINEKIDMVGINNRNLGTFFTDVENSFRLAGQLPQDAVLVSESGISDPEIVKRLRTAGFRGFLIGETFMKTEQPGETLQNFLQAIQ